MGVAELLDVRPGVTSVIGSGGKTSLLAVLARELPGTVVLTTTTHILPFEGMPLLVSPTAADVRTALAKSRVVCVGSQAEKNGKLAAPSLGIETLATLADYVLVEADGAQRLPLKVHAPWEPVIPACSNRTILVSSTARSSSASSPAARRTAPPRPSLSPARQTQRPSPTSPSSTRRTLPPTRPATLPPFSPSRPL